MAKNIIWTVIFVLIAAILQSTIFFRLAIYHAVPDLALCVLVFSAYVNGSMTGQLSGFFSGLFLDCLSAAPLGLNAFVRTLIGSLTGLMKGTFFLDIAILPMILCAAATLVKAVTLFLLHLLFADAVPSYSLFLPTLWVELMLNTFSAPFLFALLKLFSPLLVERERRET
ncbi:MAG: rod shape-determining protein MreD [Treponema sp.]|nr:rod shape-determining protein MreD [Treponema sp.]